MIYKNSCFCGTTFKSFGKTSINTLVTKCCFKLVKLMYCENNKMTTVSSAAIKLHKHMDKCHISKPPNILIYSKKEQFPYIQRVVSSVLNSDRYAVYHLSDTLLTSNPWSDHAELLCVAQNAPKPATKQFLQFHQNGGKLLCFNSNLLNSLVDTDFKSCSPTQTTVNYKGRNIEKMSCEYISSDEISTKNTSVLAHNVTGNQGVIFAVQGKGPTICSLVDLIPICGVDDKSEGETPLLSKERLELLKDLFEIELGLDCSRDRTTLLTPCYLLGSSLDKTDFLQRLRGHLPSESGEQLRLKSISLDLCHQESQVPTPTPNLLPVFVGQDKFTSPYFNSSVYFSHLKTKMLGRIVLYADVITTTMTAAEELTDYPEIVVIAGRQTQGKGRSGNAWLSPEGCAMFSLPVIIDLDSHLGRRPSFVQHLAALAIVEGILEKPGYENLDIRIKWPNDIYIGRSKCKIGGLIVTSTILKKQIYCVIGCGVNISNKHPTNCVNDVISAFNAEKKTSLENLSTDQFIAQTLTCFEKVLETFQKGGPNAVIPIYLNRWMHSGTEVTLSDGGRGVVEGLDEFGFLTVKMAIGGVRSVQPDGNSFDMLHNLISTKADRE